MIVKVPCAAETGLSTNLELEQIIYDTVVSNAVSNAVRLTSNGVKTTNAHAYQNVVDFDFLDLQHVRGLICDSLVMICSICFDLF